MSVNNLRKRIIDQAGHSAREGVMFVKQSLAITVVFIISLAAQTQDSRSQYSPDDPKKRLEEKGIPYTSEAFAESVKMHDSVAVRLFLDAGMDPNTKDKKGYPALCNARSLDIVQLLLEKGARVDERDSFGATPLICKSAGCDPEIIRTLLNAGADVNARTYWGDTPLMTAAFYAGRTECFDVLFEAGADIEARNKDGETALMLAAFCGKNYVARVLLKRGANVNARDNYGDTALMQSSEEGYTQTVKLLREQGADVNLKNNKGMTALAVAARKGHADTVDLLKEAGATR